MMVIEEKSRGDLHVKERVGSYQLTEMLGEGAHGAVYRCHHPSNPEQEYAAKIISRRGSLDNLLIEPELLSSLNHSGIVRLIDYFPVRQQLVLILELVSGTDLEGWLARNGVADVEFVREFLRQTSAALTEAHSQGVMHRDIKLANILVDETGPTPRFVVTDFGISRLAGGIQEVRSTGGTYRYMAPEQFRGRPARESDFWGLGVSAYRLLTGSYPFEGADIHDLRESVLYGAPIAIPERRNVSPDLSELIFGLYAKVVADRAIAVDQLRERLSLETGSARNKDASNQTESSWRISQRRRASRSLALFILFLLLFAVPLGLIGPCLIFGGMYFFTASQRKDTEQLGCAWLLLMLSGVLTVIFMLGQFSDATGELIESSFSLRTGLGESLFTVGRRISGVVCSFCAAFYLLKYRRLRREMLLTTEIRNMGSDVEAVILLLNQHLQSRAEDLAIRLRLAEAYTAIGDLKNCIAEAQLVLDTDPYNFQANLLVAESYLQLGCPDLSMRTCTTFHVHCGDYFEFSDIRNRCQRELGR